MVEKDEEKWSNKSDHTLKLHITEMIEQNKILQLPVDRAVITI